MHPEYARRLFACIEAADGLVGIGGGWRSSTTQAANHERDPNTFAPAGSSFHETQRFASGIEGSAAVDTVGRDGKHQEAWTWLRDNAGRFGLRTFWNVNGEPWHVQCNDLPNGVSSWKSAGRPDPPALELGGVLPSRATRRPRSADELDGDAEPDFGDFPLHDHKPPVGLGWHGDLVRYIQQVIFHKAGGKIEIDGDFGPQTDARVKDVQAISELPPTGIVDWNGSWQVFDRLAGNDRAPAASAGAAPVGVVEVQNGHYWVQRGDSPWRVAARVYGGGAFSGRLDPTDPAEPGFTRPDHLILLPGVTGAETEVRPGEGPWQIIERIRPGENPAMLLPRFYALNGGEHRTFAPGNVVFLDDR